MQVIWTRFYLADADAQAQLLREMGVWAVSAAPTQRKRCGRSHSAFL